MKHTLESKEELRKELLLICWLVAITIVVQLYSTNIIMIELTIPFVIINIALQLQCFLTLYKLQSQS